MGKPLLLAAALVAVLRVPAHAQADSASCDYSRCALSILPRVTALDVVRGGSETRVGSLSFLLPRDVGTVFGRDERARHAAGRALGIRRIAAVLTDAGIVLAAVELIHRRAPIAGVALIGASVPVHFAADAELSRAVWEYNRQFAR